VVPGEAGYVADGGGDSLTPGPVPVETIGDAEERPGAVEAGDVPEQGRVAVGEHQAKSRAVGDERELDPALADGASGQDREVLVQRLAEFGFVRSGTSLRSPAR
jgi:hypothetical protein